LILAAIPHGLRLDKEIRNIEDAIQRADKRGLFEIKVKTAVRPQDIRRAMSDDKPLRVYAEEKPQIVHFCGHGEQDGSLLLEDDSGNNKPVRPLGLASLFKLHADYVKYQQRVRESQPPQQITLFDIAPSHCDPNQIDPLKLRLQPISFYTMPTTDSGSACLYFVLDSAAGIIIYVGETCRSNKRWKGVHDCKRYIENYQSLH